MPRECAGRLPRRGLPCNPNPRLASTRLSPLPFASQGLSCYILLNMRSQPLVGGRRSCLLKQPSVSCELRSGFSQHRGPATKERHLLVVAGKSFGAAVPAALLRGALSLSHAKWHPFGMWLPFDMHSHNLCGPLACYSLSLFLSLATRDEGGPSRHWRMKFSQVARPELLGRWQDRRPRLGGWNLNPKP